MIRPLHDYLVIEIIGPPPGKVGAIFLPDTGHSSEATTCTGLVIAAGPKVEKATEGTKVVVKAYGQHPACDELIVDGKTVYMTREEHIVGLVE
ncbi:MAG: hypothetical protein ABSH26_18040 [Opitutaceae bacterium]